MSLIRLEFCVLSQKLSKIEHMKASWESASSLSFGWSQQMTKELNVLKNNYDNRPLSDLINYLPNIIAKKWLWIISKKNVLVFYRRSDCRCSKIVVRSDKKQTLGWKYILLSARNWLLQIVLSADQIAHVSNKSLCDLISLNWEMLTYK